VNIKIAVDVDLKPVYSTKESAGADLKVSEAGAILPFERVLVPTSLFMELPKGYEAQVRPRSGLAWKQGITVLNSPGTIDSDYRGEVKVMLYNTSDDVFTFKRGDRIAQLVISPVVQGNFVNEMLNETERGSGGFGSTGK